MKQLIRPRHIYNPSISKPIFDKKIYDISRVVPLSKEDYMNAAQFLLENKPIQGSSDEEIMVNSCSFSHGLMIGFVINRALLKVDNMNVLFEDWFKFKDNPNIQKRSYHTESDVLQINFDKVFFDSKLIFRGDMETLISYLLSYDSNSFNNGIMYQKRILLTMIAQKFSRDDAVDPRFINFLENHPLVKEVEKAGILSLIISCFSEEERLLLLHSAKGSKSYHELGDAVLLFLKTHYPQFVHPSLIYGDGSVYKHSDLYLLRSVLDKFADHKRSMLSLDLKHLSAFSKEKVVESLDNLSNSRYDVVVPNLSKTAKVSDILFNEAQDYAFRLKGKSKLVITSFKDTVIGANSIKSASDTSVISSISNDKSLVSICEIMFNYIQNNKEIKSVPLFDNVVMVLPSQKEMLKEFKQVSNTNQSSSFDGRLLLDRPFNE